MFQLPALEASRAAKCLQDRRIWSRSVRHRRPSQFMLLELVQGHLHFLVQYRDIPVF
jgi:hypothetical protein